MKRLPVFVMRFSLAAMISGTFVVSMKGTASLIEWAHIIAGIVTIYLIVALLLRSAVYSELRLPGAVALVLALLEAVPGIPRLHAMVSPLLFTALAWAAVAQPARMRNPSEGRLRIFVLPALVIAAIFYGVGYRHASSDIFSHIGIAMLAAGALLCVCMVINQNPSCEPALRRMASLTIAAVLFQIVMGIAAFVIRMLDLSGGLALGLARTAHITGAGAVLAAATILARSFNLRSRKTSPSATPLSPVENSVAQPEAIATLPGN